MQQQQQILSARLWIQHIVIISYPHWIKILLQSM